MTTTPDTTPDPYSEDADNTEGKPGAEIGMSDGEGSTFEPEEDPEGHDAS
jgi:hypothetical protein